jgi:hypothetical protein
MSGRPQTMPESAGAPLLGLGEPARGRAPGGAGEDTPLVTLKMSEQSRKVVENKGPSQSKSKTKPECQ